MRPHEIGLHQQLLHGLQTCHQQSIPLPGIQSAVRRDVYLRQLIDSIRRVRYVSVIAGRSIHADRANGQSSLFDPVRAALLQSRAGNFDEACWLTFLFVHFGRHPTSGYRYTREIYSALGQRVPWTFHNVAADLAGMRVWLDQNEAHLRRGSRRGFGNHRKYTSLSGSKANGTGDAFESYVHWVQGFSDHAGLFAAAFQQGGNSPEAAFEWLYYSMNCVVSFGRLAKFDYLSMLQKLGLVNIRAGRPFLDSSTSGPNNGARLLLEGTQPLSIQQLETDVRIVGNHLGVGMQEMEDSLCNWGKSPGVYRHFGG